MVWLVANLVQKVSQPMPKLQRMAKRAGLDNRAGLANRAGLSLPAAIMTAMKTIMETTMAETVLRIFSSVQFFQRQNGEAVYSSGSWLFFSLFISMAM